MPDDPRESAIQELGAACSVIARHHGLGTSGEAQIAFSLLVSVIGNCPDAAQREHLTTLTEREIRQCVADHVAYIRSMA